MIKILIVDDSPLILKVTSQLLHDSQINVHVKTAHTGSEALVLLREEPIDILLLDIVMPEMSGVELLEKLASDNLLMQLKVVMLTSVSDRQILKQCYDLGATDFIAKPIDQIEFNSRIHAAISEQTIKKRYRDSIKLLSKQNDELTHVYKQLMETQHRMVQQEQLAGVGYLAAGIAHEINNPISFVKANMLAMDKYLTQLIGYVKQLKQACPDVQAAIVPDADFSWIEEDSKTLVAETTEGIERVEKIVNSIRNFSGVDQLEGGGYFGLTDSVKTILDLVKNDFDDQIELQSEFNCNLSIAAESAPLNMALLNIMKNALYALKSEDLTHPKVLRIETWCEKDFMCCKIHDTGTGISLDDLSKVFNPFFTTKPVGTGLGLGLTVAYDVIVNQHHGQLDIKSEEGKWTEITVKLPAANPKVSFD